MDDELLDAAGPGLRVVSNLAVGFDNIDLAACARHGVAVGNTPGVLTEATADLAFALLLAVARRIPESARLVADDRWLTWDPLLLLGRDVSGNAVVGDLARMPHVLIAGATGSGKSVCINTIVASLIYQATPDELQFVMVDPKMVELVGFNGIPHLRMPVVTDLETVVGVLKWVGKEMERRYSLLAARAARNIEAYNKEIEKDPTQEKLPMNRMMMIRM